MGRLVCRELDAHNATTAMLGIGCTPVLIKGDKEEFLDWLSWGVESGAVDFPVEAGSIQWPPLSLRDVFLHSRA
jgi:hypothetical protein